MRSGLVQTGAWAAATTAGVVLSWLGVSSVLSDSAFEPPRALPLPASSATLPLAVPSSPPDPSAGPDPAARPSEAAPTRPTAPTAPTRTTPAAPATQATHPATPVTASTAPAAPPPSATPDGQASTGTVHSYLVPGGRVALDLQPDIAELVSATPDPGWLMQSWTGDGWMRFDFSQGSSTNSVFVTWNGHAPAVQTVVR
ncbi:hypothetical protein OG455_25110 [Kitasatospora sp. NBC_01287]|uniref:hypothetical protein n=1 Tax=Kitasatospora sp. NBC_01287 TaxID=2903573 RepID=UPI00225199DE|nr:hypothetical protein [Kitasatospora sp. NBC_01287]MCX4748755.1 hypothetical protein [Kitasatospora sp. NBC_01287]